MVAGRTQDANDMALEWAAEEVVHQVEQEVEATWEEIERGIDDARDWADDRWEDVKTRWPW